MHTRIYRIMNHPIMVAKSKSPMKIISKKRGEKLVSSEICRNFAPALAKPLAK